MKKRASKISRPQQVLKLISRSKEITLAEIVSKLQVTEREEYRRYAQTLLRMAKMRQLKRKKKNDVWSYKIGPKAA